MTERLRIVTGLRLLVAICALVGALLSSPVSAFYQCTDREQRECVFSCVEQGADGGSCSGGTCYCY